MPARPKEDSDLSLTQRVAADVAAQMAEPSVLALPERARTRLRRRITAVLYILAGVPVSDALHQAKVNVTERRALQLVAAYRAAGTTALIDRRLLPRVPGRNPRRVRTEEVENIVREVLHETSVSSTRLIRRVQEECAVAGMPVPSPATIRRIIHDQRQ